MNLASYTEIDSASGFQQQLDDGILEEFDLNNVNLDEHVFIPHHPVIKTDENVTTKVRVVLNCSMKTGNSPSLNEATYPGVDLLKNLLDLLLKIRTNNNIVFADIRQAFLQIRLSKETDRNKFSVLWMTPEGELRAFRYNTIVFGLSCSPFILNYVIKDGRYFFHEIYSTKLQAEAYQSYFPLLDKKFNPEPILRALKL